MTTKETENTTSLLDDVNSDVLRVIENQPTYFQCIVIGGYPSVDVRIYLNETDITTRSKFERSYRVTWFDDDKECVSMGLRRVIHVVEMTSIEFRVNHKYDEMPIRCIAMATATMTSMEARVVLDVQCEL